MTTMTLATDRAGDHRTREAVLRWAAALPADRYLVSAIPTDTRGPPHRRLLTLEELGRALGWLRWLNGNGHHIVGRPWAARHVLVDDLAPAAVEALLRRHTPSAVVESSPGSLQAWLTLADAPVAPAIAGAAARLLAGRLGGDRGAAGPVQPGRIPGFTNRKARHRVAATGLYPFALLHRADGPRVDGAGADILAEAAALAAQAPRRAPPAASNGHRRALVPRAPEAEHAAARARVAATLPPGAVIDRSRLDHAAALRLLARGLSIAEATAVVMAGEKAGEMGADAGAAYARRTVEAAAAALGRRPPPWASPQG